MPPACNCCAGAQSPSTCLNAWAWRIAADSHPGEMSGGEQQRIAIARALVRRPRVILADEPTGALDPDTGRAVMTLLEEVARESDSALIVITHDMAVAARASRAYELYDGVLHEVTDPGTLTQRAEAGNSDADNAGTGGKHRDPLGRGLRRLRWSATPAAASRAGPGTAVGGMA